MLNQIKKNLFSNFVEVDIPKEATVGWRLPLGKRQPTVASLDIPTNHNKEYNTIACLFQG